MGVLGEPDAELGDLLAEIDGAQQAAFATVRAGARGGDVIAAGEANMAGMPLIIPVCRRMLLPSRNLPMR